MNKTFRQFIKFGLVGLLSFLVDAGIYLILTRYLAVFYLIAKMISFILAAINSYIFNRAWTFRSKNTQIGREFIQFFIVSSIGLGLNSLIMFLAVDYIKLNDILGLVIATAITMFWNFSANKLWVFKKSDIIKIEK